MEKEQKLVIQKLREHWQNRIKEEEITSQLALYVPTMLGFTEKDAIEKRLSGVDEIQRFITSDKQLLLLLGDSGAGKSLFGQWLVNHWWEKDSEFIPIFIHLPAIKIKKGFLEKYFRKQCDLTKEEIEDLKRQHRLLLILDSYDEIKPKYKGKNVHQVGELFKWNVKVIISCRTEGLVSYNVSQQSEMFVPYRAKERLNSGWEKRHVQAFDPKTEIPEYVMQWKHLNPDAVDPNIDYLKILTTLPHISEMITNPFILWIVLLSLPKILKELADEKKELQQMHLTRLSLFGTFTNAWFERQKEKMKRNDLIDAAWLETIVDDYRVYCQQLANLMWQNKIYSVKYEAKSHPLQVIKVSNNEELRKDNSIIYLVEQSNRVIAHYFDGNRWSSLSQEMSDLYKVLPSFNQLTKWSDPADVEKITSFFGCLFWDVFFTPEGHFNENPKKPLQLIRSGALLKIIEGNTYAFLHPSLLEYFSCKTLFESAANKVTIALGLEINNQLFTKDLARIRLGADCVKENPEFEEALWDILEESKHEARISIAAANAATILAAANRSFADKDLKRIRIKGANLSGGNFEGTNLEETDLRNVNLSQSWLNHAKFNGSCVDDIQTGEMLEDQLESEVKICAFAPDGRHYAVSTEKKLMVYNATTHELLKLESPNLTKDENFTSLTFSPLSDTVLLGTDEGNLMWIKIPSGEIKRKWHGHDKEILSIIVSDDAQWVLSGGSDEIKRWNLSTGHCDTSWGTYSSGARAMIFSPCRQFVFSGRSAAIQKWNLSTGELIATYGEFTEHQDDVVALAISHDGTWLLSGSLDGTIKRWDISTEQCIATWTDHNSGISALVLNSDSTWALSASYDATIKRWSTTNGDCTLTIKGHTHIINSLALSPDESWALTVSRDKSVKRWRIESIGHELGGHKGAIFALSIQSNGMKILSASGDATIKEWDPANGLSGTTLRGHKGAIRAVYISHSGALALSGADDGTIKVWNITKGFCTRTMREHTDLITAIVVSPDEKWFYSSSRDGTIKKWNLKNRSCISTWQGKGKWTLAGHEDTAKTLALSPDGSYLLSDRNGEINLWEIESGLRLASWKGHEGIISKIVINSNGNWALSGSWDRTIKRWNIGTKKCEAIWHGHTSWVVALVISPNDKLAISGGADHKVILWDTNQGISKREYMFLQSVSILKWCSTDPTSIVMGMDDGSVSLWLLSENTDLHLRWRSQPWGLEANNLHLLGAYGLSPDLARVLIQKKAQVQVSSKRSEVILAQREQFEPYDPDRSPYCLFDQTIQIRPEAWAISIVRKKDWDKKKEENDPRQHAFLILQTIEDGYHRIRKIDFVLELRHHYIQDEKTTGRNIGVFGQGLIEVVDKSLFDIESLVPKCCALSQGILPAQGLQLLQNIRFAQSQRIGYTLMGAGGMYRMFRMKEAIAHHNCMSWCEEQLRLIGVTLTEQTWQEGIINDPRKKLQEVKLDKSPLSKPSLLAIKPSSCDDEQNSKEQKDEEPTSGSKCSLM